ncbi:uncharacterized protein L201_004434 [Kwoniella dendrophila CBS 6074]|uniref:DUF1753-domain-containing protein n=1 Tax=Kwoniella dendrophila CBS 6074 TaxID=1295534 RepID=A0AAX4JY57_9TREE
MKLTFKWPGGSTPIFSSFLGLLDIKLGAEIILLFGLINKVAGLYGLITIFIGGSFVQLLFYAYSTATLFAFLWGLKVVKSESAKSTLFLSHLYSLDHLVLTIFHYLFYLNYWYNIPHDGKRISNSQAQQDLINLALSRNEITQPSNSGTSTEALDELRSALAGEIWEREKVFAGWTLIIGWLLKIYFIILLYSYAAHLKSSTYHTLPLTFRGKATIIAHPNTQEDEIEIARAEEATRASLEEGDRNVVGGGVGKGKGKGKSNEEDEDFSWD